VDLLRRVWQEHSLAAVTVSVFLAMTLATVLLGHHQWAAEAQAHGEPLVASEFWWWWASEYNLSLVADVFGGLYLIVATKRLRERGSAESQD
jgi:hypothetical protein